MRATFLLVLTAILLQAQATDALKTGAIVLTFKDSVTGLPVRGVTVNLRHQDGSRTHDAVTDADGKLELTDLPPSHYSFRSVEATGYKFDYAAHIQGIRLNPGEHLKLATIAIDPPGSISGTVTDADGKPVASATVDLLESPLRTRLLPRGSTITDSEGRYKFANILPGRLFARVSSNTQRGREWGIPATYYPVGDDIEQAVRIDVRPGIATERIDFHVRRVPLLHIRGTVDRPAGARAMLTVSPCVTRDVIVLGNGTPVKEDGSFDAAVLPGEYCLEARIMGKDGNQAPVAAYVRTAVRVTGRDIENIRQIPVPPFDLIGVVKLEDGTGLRMPSTISLLGNPEPQQGEVKPDGSFRLTNVFSGDYTLLMTAAGGYVKAIKLGGLAMADGHVDLTAGSGPVVIEIAPARARAKMKVNFGSTRPAQIVVVLSPINAAGRRSDLAKIIEANEQGELTLESLAPGLYKVYAFANPDRDLLSSTEFLNIFSSTTVRIADGEEPNIELRLIPRSEFDDVKGRF
jgi:protocatechuate 3,4-dioxygenase beta subunit